MLKKNVTRLLLSGLGLSVGCALVLVSLATTHKPGGSLGQRLCDKSLYAGKVLPDHLFYPVLAGMDRITLLSTSGADQVKLQVAYAQNRQSASQALLAKGKQSLALNTLIKAHQYLIAAAHSPLLETDQELKTLVQQAIEEQQLTFRSLRQSFTQVDASALDRLIQENRSVSERLGGVDRG